MPAAAVDKRQRIMQIREVMTVLFLAVMGWKDWKKKEISLVLTGTYGIIGLAFSIMQKDHWKTGCCHLV